VWLRPAVVQPVSAIATAIIDVKIAIISGRRAPSTFTTIPFRSARQTLQTSLTIRWGHWVVGAGSWQLIRLSAEPQAVVGRDDQLDSFDLLLARIKRGRTEQSMIITGLRGVGKTVLLGQFRVKALERDWVVVELEVSKHDDTDFRRDISGRLRTALLQLSPKARWTDRYRHAASVLKSFTINVDVTGSVSAGLDVAAAEGFADHANLTMDLTDVRPAKDEGVEFTEEALDAAATITGGYPYFIQELGYAVWTVADGPGDHPGRHSVCCAGL
jgi:AAA ATPase domain